jgi:hypothetical protein
LLLLIVGRPFEEQKVSSEETEKRTRAHQSSRPRFSHQCSPVALALCRRMYG